MATAAPGRPPAPGAGRPLSSRPQRSCQTLLLVWLALIGMRGDFFHPLVLFGTDFVCLIFIKNFQTFLEVKIDINWINLTPCQAH